MSDDQVTIIRNGQIEYGTVKQLNGDSSIQELSIQRRALPKDGDGVSVASAFPSSFSFSYRRNDYYDSSQ
jgi:hypothetical protein